MQRFFDRYCMCKNMRSFPWGKKTFVNLSSLVPDVSSPLSVHVHVSTLVTLASFRVIGPPIYMYVRLPE